MLIRLGKFLGVYRSLPGISVFVHRYDFVIRLRIRDGTVFGNCRCDLIFINGGCIGVYGSVNPVVAMFRIHTPVPQKCAIFDPYIFDGTGHSVRIIGGKE